MPTSLTQETNIDQSIESRILESFKLSHILGRTNGIY